MADQVRTAVIGGSGLYSFLEPVRTIAATTEFGDPSDEIVVALVEGEPVAFLPRHGRKHTLAPHRINYRANMRALADIGVERIFAPCAVGALNHDLDRGDIVICDQLIDVTHGRDDTYFDESVAHVAMADPYCPQLRDVAITACRGAGLHVHTRGTVVVIQGPRFSTRAESRMHAARGATVINMTQYPEVALARELGICYAALALVTDHDAGVEDDPGIAPVTQEAVMEVFASRTEILRRALADAVAALPSARDCSCAGGRPAVLSH